MPTTTLTPEERFWSKVDKDGPVPQNRPELGKCWIWTRACQNGYGVFSFKGQNVKAHRWAYESLVGVIEQSIDHLCRNRSCVNPSHLEDVAVGENNRRSTGYRFRRAHCPKGHAYAEHGREQSGYMTCRTCDNERHREARRRKWAEMNKIPRKSKYEYDPASY